MHTAQDTPAAGAYFNEADTFEVDWQEQFWGTDNYNKLLGMEMDTIQMCIHNFLSFTRSLCPRRQGEVGPRGSVRLPPVRGRGGLGRGRHVQS